ncbi:hypothetical protein D3C78_1439600 [compost metagenome]
MPFHTDRRAGHQRFALRMAQAVEQIARCHVVGTVQHQIVGGNLCRHLFIVQLPVNGINMDMRIDGAQFDTRRINLRHANARVAVQDLALQVGERNGVEINQRQMTHPCGSQIGRGGATQATQADNQHPCGFQLFLTVEVETAQDNLAVIAQCFGIG